MTPFDRRRCIFARSAWRRHALFPCSALRTIVEVDNCGADAYPDAIGFVRVEHRTGGTRPGSSGSGLFNAAGELVGTDLGGPDAGASAYYGRSDRPYRAGLARGLAVGRLRGLQAER